MPLFSLHGHRPDLAESGTCYVAETAVVIGKVRIKAGASVWFGAVLRGDNEWIEIGERSNVQDNCTFHTDPGFPLAVGERLHHRPQRDPARLHDRQEHADRHGRDRDERRADRLELHRRRRRAGQREKIVYRTTRWSLARRRARCATTTRPAIRLIASAAEIYFQRWQEYAARLKAPALTVLAEDITCSHIALIEPRWAVKNSVRAASQLQRIRPRTLFRRRLTPPPDRARRTLRIAAFGHRRAVSCRRLATPGADAGVGAGGSQPPRASSSRLYGDIARHSDRPDRVDCRSARRTVSRPRRTVRPSGCFGFSPKATAPPKRTAASPAKSRSASNFLVSFVSGSSTDEIKIAFSGGKAKEYLAHPRPPNPDARAAHRRLSGPASSIR